MCMDWAEAKAMLEKLNEVTDIMATFKTLPFPSAFVAYDREVAWRIWTAG